MRFTFIFIMLIVLVLTDAWWSRSSRSRSSRWSSSSYRRSSSSPRRFSYDLNKKSLTRVYNSPVKKVESYSRPLNGFLGKVGVKHTGVVATTNDGKRWLIHKGSGYGKSSSTVLVDAKHMSDRWKKTGSRLTNGKTISDVMKDGLVNKKYGVGPNRGICWDASRNIMKKAGGRRKRSC